MKKYYTIWVFSVVVLLASCTASRPILDIDFDGSSPSPKEQILLDHNLIRLSEGDGIGASNCIEVRYVGYDRGSQRVVREIDLPFPLKEATLRFAVRFNADFKFVKGGKLHGLGPKDKVTGGNPIHPDGWSARIMFKDSGKVAPYVYHQDMKGKYGEGTISENPVFTPGKWHHVAIYVKVNSKPDTHNGVFQVWVDGKKIGAFEAIGYRGNKGDHTLINVMLFSTFHGGNTPLWAPKNEAGAYTVETAWFDNFAVYKGKYVRKL